MTATLDQTIREIVANDFRAAAVFQRHGVDFCCNGCRSVEQGCREAGADEAAVLRELEGIGGPGTADVPQYSTWSARELVAHIVGKHHHYVREAVPMLRTHIRKIADVHGERHPELLHIAGLVEQVTAEMAEHMEKEERVLFPFIVSVAEAVRANRPQPTPPFGTVQNPIRMMEADHQFVGDAMAEIRQLTNGYQPPDDGCTTYRVCLEELDAFERDLHAHVHLENNILFPMAEALEKEGSTA